MWLLDRARGSWCFRVFFLSERLAACIEDGRQEGKVRDTIHEQPKAAPGEPQPVPTPKRLTGMNNTAWKNARERAAEKWEKQRGEPAPPGFRTVRVHDLKHTFGRRLRAAGVTFEDRQDLLGHKSGRVTTHYSAAALRTGEGGGCRPLLRTRYYDLRGSPWPCPISQLSTFALIVLFTWSRSAWQTFSSAPKSSLLGPVTRPPWFAARAS